MNKVLCLVALLFAGVANATIISGDFRTESDLPYCCFDAGPLVYEDLNASVGAGNELDSTDLLSNDSDWFGGSVFIDLDRQQTSLLSVHKITSILKFSLLLLAISFLMPVNQLQDCHGYQEI
ncbi:hypothetical protein Q4567_14625 [Aliiglaciecola sp. 2_MG-2023]|uniref:hypothetical protein n=1 Tax=unclassified Aliiglaciecola TaxID=2593648 RepID=UPI0026E13552|nr:MULTISPECIES: hypothetical protein [unclassified Aliiglaciecola]MDO6711966.1 hypothetical protein [Aliiglaciecola sp. 2_MG-2023]MDO6753060.1 hypothetical protein [Aliiglaciecola sp. 1_MG-2023]